MWTAVGCTASYFVKIIYDGPVGSVLSPPPPHLMQCNALFAGRRRVAIARYRMIFLVSVKTKIKNLKAVF